MMKRMLEQMYAPARQQPERTAPPPFKHESRRMFEETADARFFGHAAQKDVWVTVWNGPDFAVNFQCRRK
jgi:hypothetical protein